MSSSDLAPGAAREDAAHDWRAIEALPEFRELVARKRRFIVPAAIVSLGCFLVYLMLAAFATDLMGSRVAGVSVAWLLAVSQVLLCWAVTWLYLRKSDREWDPLERRVVERAAAEYGERFVRDQSAAAREETR
jgi:uncharacterized membrane protein (DUF485 family)